MTTAHHTYVYHGDSETRMLDFYVMPLIPPPGLSRLSFPEWGGLTMSDQTRPRAVLVVPNWPDDSGGFPIRTVDEVQPKLHGDIRLWLERNDPGFERQAAANFAVDYISSNVPVPPGLDIRVDGWRRMLVCGIVMENETAVQHLAAIINDVYGSEASIGADLLVSAADTVERDRLWTHWCPSEAPSGLFGDRAAALRAMGGLPAPGPRAVNIVFVDTGLPATILPPGPFKGWDVTVFDQNSDIIVRRPGEPLTGHGAMVARNARAVARSSGVTLLDCPAIPDGIMNLPAFLGTIVGAIHSVKNTIAAMQGGGGQSPAAWVICNAWGVFNPTRESPTVPYSDNPDHPLAVAYRELEALGADIVFAAGNCGEFCPNHRCSPVHIGSGRSIHGVNALAEVLTVGAVRSDGPWLGYSGQGPGITNMAHDKPDLCAPSQFDDDDGFGPNTGTSAACGLAAGAVALLRTRAPTTMTPLTLRTILCDTAEQPYGPKGWQERTGHGVINPVKAAAALP